jgi:hypothetical protein
VLVLFGRGFDAFVIAADAIDRIGEPDRAVGSDGGSFGEFSRLPLYLSAMMVIEPSSSVRVTRRPPCSQVISRPSRSIVLPLEFIDGCRNTLTWPSSSQ